MRFLLAACAGALFGLGLLVSGMIDPQIVLGFFDLAGAWNPQLAFVMGGAVSVMALAWRLRSRMQSSLVGAPLPGPASPVIDAKLLGGSVLFGVGWGITGLCPAPAIAALGLTGPAFWAFAAAMGVGLLLPSKLAGRRDAIAKSE